MIFAVVVSYAQSLESNMEADKSAMHTFRREEQSAVRAQAWDWRRLCRGISIQA